MRAFKSQDAAGLLEDAERMIFAVAQRDLRTEALSNRAVIEDALTVLDKRINQFRKGQLTAAASYGLTDLDAATAGIHAGEVAIVAARPGVGKTIMACHLADVNTAAGTPVLFVSLEQSATELALRLLAKHTKINAFKFRRGTLTDIEKPVIFDAVDEFAAAPLWWDDTPSQSIVRIGAQARRMKSKHGLGMLIVDYLQLIACPDKSMKRYDAIGEISRGLKLLARDLKIPVVAMAQLNRESEQRGGEPRLSDLRESGNIEQDADTVILMHPEDDVIKLLIRKQRNGPLLTVSVLHEKEFYKLTNMVPSFGAPKL
jgi:replicative DNA helicase